MPQLIGVPREVAAGEKRVATVPEVVEKLIKLAPLERLGQPGDIANVVAFLAGRDGGWVNGQILRANGGII